MSIQRTLVISFRKSLKIQINFFDEVNHCYLLQLLYHKVGNAVFKFLKKKLKLTINRENNFRMASIQKKLNPKSSGLYNCLRVAASAKAGEARTACSEYRDTVV